MESLDQIFSFFDTMNFIQLWVEAMFIIYRAIIRDIQ